jgi:nucleotide-binding universal stress UspA family protein
VLGTEGRSGLARVMLGSVAEYLVRRLSVDVLLVRRQRS